MSLAITGGGSNANTLSVDSSENLKYNTKTVAMTDSDISGTAAGLSATLTITKGGTGRTTTASGAWYTTAASQSSITVGTLPVAQGGTGLSTSTYKNALIKGNASTATSAFSTVRTASGALYATGQDAAPSFGTLPVAQGGTGRTTTASGAWYTTAASQTSITVGTLPVAQGGTGQTNLDNVTVGTTKKLRVLSSAPSSPANGEIWIM